MANRARDLNLPSFEDAGASGNSSLSSNYSTITKCRKMGFSFISQALKCEELGKGN